MEKPKGIFKRTTFIADFKSLYEYINIYNADKIEYILCINNDIKTTIELKQNQVALLLLTGGWKQEAIV